MLSSMKANRIIKRTNPFSGQSEMLTHDEAMLHDQVKQAEAMGEYTKMQKCLDKFSKLNPKARNLGSRRGTKGGKYNERISKKGNRYRQYY